MDIEKRLAQYSLALSELFVAVEECRRDDSHMGSEISADEIRDALYPKMYDLRVADHLLYTEVAREQSKHEEVLIGKCIECDKFLKKDCEIYMEQGLIKDSETFRRIAEVNNYSCMTIDFPELTVDNFLVQ